MTEEIAIIEGDVEKTNGREADGENSFLSIVASAQITSGIDIVLFVSVSTFLWPCPEISGFSFSFSVYILIHIVSESL